MNYGNLNGMSAYHQRIFHPDLARDDFYTTINGEVISFEQWMIGELKAGYILRDATMFQTQEGHVLRVATEFFPDGQDTHRSSTKSYGAERLCEMLGIF